MQIHNRTPHPITIMAADGRAVVATLPAASRRDVARVESTTVEDGALAGLGVPLLRTRWGQVVGLPDPTWGDMHVVSVIVAEAAIDSGRGADDLLVPGDQVRDDSGRIVGCRGLARASSASPALAGRRTYEAAQACHIRTDPEAMNCRPEPEDLPTEAMHLVRSFDSWVATASDRELRGGWCYNASERHGALRSAIIALVRREATTACSEEMAGLPGGKVRAAVVDRVMMAIARAQEILPCGHTGQPRADGTYMVVTETNE
jgi:hypothetical protein